MCVFSKKTPSKSYKIKRKLTMKKYIILALLMLPLSLFAQTMVQGKITLKDATETFAEAGVSI